jgi:DNA invertase Pin-like site-specific DNA recombinase
MAIRGTHGDTAKGEVVRRRVPTDAEIMRDRDDLVLREVFEGLIPRRKIAKKYGISRMTLYRIIERAPDCVRRKIPMQPRPYRGTTENPAPRAP